LGLEGFDGIFFDGIDLGKALVVVEVNEISCSVILSSLATFRAVPGEVSYFSALETCI